MLNKEKIYQKLSDAVVNMDEEAAVAGAEEAVSAQMDAFEAIDKGLSDGMTRAGKLFDEEEYFVPELLLCSEAMNAGLEVLKPHLRNTEASERYKVVIGVVQGDTHDIGKNLVKLMLEASGFAVTDLGRDVPPSVFVERAIEIGADIIGISTLMTTSMDAMSKVIKLLHQQNVRDRFKVIVGGGPVSQAFANKIGADGYAVNAAEAVWLAKRLVGDQTLPSAV